MLDKKREKIEELKSICKAVFAEENDKYGLDGKIHPITVGEYYNSDGFKQQTILKQLKGRFDLRNTGGITQDSGESFVFVDNMGKKQNIYSDDKLAALLLCTYHEFRHQLQVDFCNKFIDDYMIILADAIKRTYMPGDYGKHHDAYYSEIDANLYGVDMARKYLQQRYLERYEEVKEYLDEKEDKARYNLNNFDYQVLFDEFYQLTKENNIMIASFKGFDVFFDYYNCFNDLSEIMNSSDLAMFDERVVCGILGSKSFIDQLSEKKLSSDEKQFMFDIFNKILNSETKRMEQNTKLYDDGKIKTKEYLSLCKVILDKTIFLKEKSLGLGLRDIHIPDNLINRDLNLLKK